MCRYSVLVIIFLLNFSWNSNSVYTNPLLSLNRGLLRPKSNPELSIASIAEDLLGRQRRQIGEVNEFMCWKFGRGIFNPFVYPQKHLCSFMPEKETKVFRNPNDCRQFSLCSPDLTQNPIHCVCENGFAFNAQQRKCVSVYEESDCPRPFLVKTSMVSSSYCESESKKFPHPQSCFMYIHCVPLSTNKSAFNEYHCPHNFGFDPVLAVCSENYDCKNIPPVACLKAEQSCVTNPNDNRPHSDSPNRFNEDFTTNYLNHHSPSYVVQRKPNRKPHHHYETIEDFSEPNIPVLGQHSYPSEQNAPPRLEELNPGIHYSNPYAKPVNQVANTANAEFFDEKPQAPMNNPSASEQFKPQYGEIPNLPYAKPTVEFSKLPRRPHYTDPSLAPSAATHGPYEAIGRSHIGEHNPDAEILPQKPYHTVSPEAPMHTPQIPLQQVPIQPPKDPHQLTPPGNLHATSDPPHLTPSAHSDRCFYEGLFPYDCHSYLVCLLENNHKLKAFTAVCPMGMSFSPVYRRCIKTPAVKQCIGPHANEPFPIQGRKNFHKFMDFTNEDDIFPFNDKETEVLRVLSNILRKGYTLQIEGQVYKFERIGFLKRPVLTRHEVPFHVKDGYPKSTPKSHGGEQTQHVAPHDRISPEFEPEEFTTTEAMFEMITTTSTTTEVPTESTLTEEVEDVPKPMKIVMESTSSETGDITTESSIEFTSTITEGSMEFTTTTEMATESTTTTEMGTESSTTTEVSKMVEDVKARAMEMDEELLLTSTTEQPTKPLTSTTNTTEPPEALTTTTTEPPEELTTTTTEPPEELTTTTTDPPEELTTVTFTEPLSELIITTTSKPPEKFTTTTTTEPPEEFITTTTTEPPEEFTTITTTGSLSEPIITTTSESPEEITTTTELLTESITTTTSEPLSEPIATTTTVPPEEFTATTTTVPLDELMITTTTEPLDEPIITTTTGPITTTTSEPLNEPMTTTMTMPLDEPTTTEPITTTTIDPLDEPIITTTTKPITTTTGAPLDLTEPMPMTTTTTAPLSEPMTTTTTEHITTTTVEPPVESTPSIAVIDFSTTTELPSESLTTITTSDPLSESTTPTITETEFHDESTTTTNEPLNESTTSTTTEIPLTSSPTTQVTIPFSTTESFNSSQMGEEEMTFEGRARESNSHEINQTNTSIEIEIEMDELEV